MDKEHNVDEDIDLTGELSLGKQVTDYLNETDESEAATKEDTYVDEESELLNLNDSLASQINSVMEEEEKFQNHLQKKKKRKKKIIIASSIAAVFVLVICFFAFTKAGQKQAVSIAAGYIYDNAFEYEEAEVTKPIEQEPVDEVEEVVVEPEVKDNVVNILLLGLEEHEHAQNTDSMMIATMNRDKNTLSIISLMRDLYVDIPGHGKNKLNSAYASGGIGLLYETIQNNFGIQLDGYVMVNYEAFETVIDLLGGIPVTLTKAEAKYLNKENYISDKRNRNVVAGTQTMNGNQALGYCRIRYVSNGKETDDYGRTARQRAVLSKMYEKIMSKNVVDLLKFMNKVFDNVQLKTDISKSKFSDYMTEVVDLNVKELNQYRIPSANTFKALDVTIGKHVQNVLVPNDWQETKDILHTYIYGEEDRAEDGTKEN